MDEIFIELDSDERALYEAVEHRAQMRINRYLREGDVLKNYSSILAMLVRLRQLCIHPMLIMEHVSDTFTAEDITTALSHAGSDPEKHTALQKMVEAIAGTPAGDWSECPLCLDEPGDAVMTVCRHVFCGECINSVFDMPNARGAADDDDDDADEDLAVIGESIACPVCRHKLFRKDVGKFIAPVENSEPAPPTREEIEEFKNTVWGNSEGDDSDDDSLPDLGTIFAKSKALVKTETAVVKVETKVETSMALTTTSVDLTIDENEDLFELFKNNAVSKEAPKRIRENSKEHYWEDVLETENLIPSSKLNQLCDQLREWREEYPEDKVIIFSQFTRALDLVHKICRENGWECGRYQGNMTLDQREASLRAFEDDGEMGIMLVSLKCGGVGLNLTVANRVICLDLWWNWQIENQAIDRYVLRPILLTIAHIEQAKQNPSPSPVSSSRILSKNVSSPYKKTRKNWPQRPWETRKEDV